MWFPTTRKIMLLFISSFLLLTLDGLVNADGDLQFLLDKIEDNKLFPDNIVRTLNLDLEIFSYLNAQCKNDFKAIATGVMRKEMWAIKMLDAYGKPGSGLTQGKLVWPGRFSMCLNVTQEIKRKSVDAAEKAFRGQFCWIVAKPKIKIIDLSENYPGLGTLKIGICIPDSCNTEDLSLLLTAIDNFHFVNKYVNLSSHCVPSNRDIWKNKKAVISLMFCFFMLIMCLIATSYDIYLHSTLNLSVKNDAKSVRNGEVEKVNTDKQLSTSHEELSFDNEDDQLLQPSDDATPVTHKRKTNKLLLCFSFYTNGKKLFSCELNDQSLLCLNGIRVICIQAIILPHNMSVLMFENGADNMLIVMEWIHELWFKYVLVSGFCALTTFFLMSGTLLTYTVFRKFKVQNLNPLLLVKIFLHRLIRISPLYFVILFVFEIGLLPYFSNSPLWPARNKACETDWLSIVLYINNNINSLEIDRCLPHTWFLATDMQIYILCAFLILFYNYQRIGAFIAGCIVLINLIILGLQSTTIWVGTTVAENLTKGEFTVFNRKLYFWMPVLIYGMACGYVLHKVNCKAIITQKTVVSGWITAAIFILLAYNLPDHIPDIQFFKSAFITLYISVVATSVVWIIFACCNGYGGFVNKFLSLPVWIPLSRLSFAVYLIHRAVLKLMVLGGETLPHLTISFVVSSFISSTVYSYMAAICLHLLFEAPFARMVATILH